ncbi:MAG: hypothetical protein IKC85_02655, partial [Bacteroidaceae bacterium]|nr:hypothetical protein [Bacteroidaceae bacterium]
MITETPQLNEHNKQECPPMHNGELDTSPIAIYTSEDNTISLDVKLENETVWLSQSQMALLFDTDRTSILRHINNVYKIGELERESTCAKIAQVQKNGIIFVVRITFIHILHITSTPQKNGNTTIKRP